MADDIGRENFTGNNSVLSNTGHSAEDIVREISYSCLSLVAIIGNSLTILSILKFDNMKTVTNIFIACLALSDFLMGCAMFCLFVYEVFRPAMNYYICMYFIVSTIFSITSSIIFFLGKIEFIIKLSDIYSKSCSSISAIDC